jgi:hypothetical protein
MVAYRRCPRVFFQPCHHNMGMENPENEIEGAVGTMYHGNCAKVRSLNIWIHLLVNVRFARPNTSITTPTVTSGPLYAASCGFQLLHASS